MRRIIMIAAMVLASLAHGAALAEPVDYRTALRACGEQWRASEDRKAVPKGQGMAAWQTFRKDCVAKSGYVSKRRTTATQ